tara:strand:- start:222228 stop:222977 length:750 start_codon:yes stop_codon:yes gene_type:complete
MSHLLELAKNISEKLNELEKGNLDKQGLNDVIADTTQLQEALYILRFKGYEEAEAAKTKPQQNIKLDFGSVQSNQISLIDAIEEAQVGEKPIEVKLEEVAEPKIVWDNNPASSVVENTKSVEPEVKTEEPVQKEKVVANPVTEVDNNQVSLNEKIKQDTGTQRLGDKLQQTAIKDLRVAISINQRFLFINSLFDGRTEVFNEALEKIESATTGYAAKEIEKELIQRHGWDVEDKNVMQFSNLIERRFLQ